MTSSIVYNREAQRGLWSRWVLSLVYHKIIQKSILHATLIAFYKERRRSTKTNSAFKHSQQNILTLRITTPASIRQFNSYLPESLPKSIGNFTRYLNTVFSGDE